MLLRRLIDGLATEAVKRENARLTARLADLEAELDAERRQSRVRDAEIETLTAVIARDRSRIQAETAAFARQRAESEGVSGRAHESLR